MASAFLSRTHTASNRKTFTFSTWVKISNLGQKYFIGTWDGSHPTFGMYLKSDDTLEVFNYTSSYDLQITTNRKFRDVSAWYHIVVAVDTTQSTSSDRVKVYVNGVQETSFATATYPSQNFDTDFNTAKTIYYFQNASNAAYWDGLVSHTHLTDGYAYAASSFGETDSTSGIWKAKTSPSVSYGTNGFFLKFENSANMGLDSSGQTNNLTVGGTITQSPDTPSNNFATFNLLETPEPGETPTYSNGALQGVSTNGGHINGISTLAVETGKWYAEFKITNRSGDTDDFIGCIAAPATDLGTNDLTTPASNNRSYGIRGGGGKYEAGSGSSFHGGWAVNDIIGVGLDVTNNRIYFSKNGQWQNGTSWDSATPNSYITLPSGNTWHFFCGDTSNSYNYTWQANFGSGYFGTTQVSSSNADANGHGLMEYAPPSGYYTLNTKNIKEFG